MVGEEKSFLRARYPPTSNVPMYFARSCFPKAIRICSIIVRGLSSKTTPYFRNTLQKPLQPVSARTMSTLLKKNFKIGLMQLASGQLQVSSVEQHVGLLTH